MLVYSGKENYSLRQVIGEFQELVDRDHCNWCARSGFEEDEEQVDGVEWWLDLERSSSHPLRLQDSVAGEGDLAERFLHSLHIPKSETPFDRRHLTTKVSICNGGGIYIVLIHFSGSSCFFGVELQDFDNGLGILCIVLLSNG